MPSALFARPRFFNDCSEKDTVRLLMSRPVALICSAISAAERAPCRPRTSAIAEPMVWRASATKDLELAQSPERWERNLNKAVEKMFKHYPGSGQVLK